jgi:hypothetical protein
MSLELDCRLAALRVALGFLQLPPRAPELRLPLPLARRLDRSRPGRRGSRAAGAPVLAEPMAEGWRAVFMTPSQWLARRKQGVSYERGEGSGDGRSRAP